MRVFLNLLLPLSVYVLFIRRQVAVAVPSYYAAVITLPGDDMRYEDFVQSWSRAWPELSVTKQLCFRHSPKFRSLGLFACFYQALRVFLDRPDHESYDYVLLFEDDGVPFSNTTWPDDLVVRIDAMEREGVEMLVMGGHAVNDNVREWTRVDPEKDLLFEPSSMSGSYGFMINASTAAKLADGLEQELKVKRDAKSGVDHHIWKIYGKRGRLSVPLLVDHRPGSSNTWTDVNKTPGRKFEGQRDFWNFLD